MRDKYYWPTMFKDAHTYVQKCNICQKCACKEKKPTIPLPPFMIKDPFEYVCFNLVQ